MVVLLTVAALVALFGAIAAVAPGTPAAPAAATAVAPSPDATATTETESPATPSPDPTPEVDAAGVPSPTPTADPAGTSDGAVTLAFTGDVHGEKHIAAALARGEHPLAEIAPTLRAADLAIVNLETAVGSTGQPAPKQYAFQAPAALLDELTWAGVDVVSLANTHSLDFGREGLSETMALADRAGLGIIGAGRTDREAYAPLIRDVRGIRIAVVGLTRVWPDPAWAATAERPGLAGAYDVRRAVAAVVEARRVADVVTVVIHWGTESEGCPDSHQLELGAALREAGADVVVGHHPHVLQGVEHRDGQLLAYSLGNFLWYTAGEVSRLTGVLQVEVNRDGASGWELVPAIVSPADGGPRPAAADDAAQIAGRVRRLVPGDLCSTRPTP